MWLKRYRQEPTRTGYLTFWDCLVTPDVVQLKDHGLLAALRFRGPDLHSAMESALILQAQRLNSVFRRLPGSWTLLTDARHRAVADYPISSWENPVAALLDTERAAVFTAPGNLYETEYVLTLVYRAPDAASVNWKALLYTHMHHEAQDGVLASFLEEISRFEGLFQEACPFVERLTETALLSYLHGTITPTPHGVQVPYPPAHLDTYLAGDVDVERLRVLPSLLLWPRIASHWVRCVGVKSYPQETAPGMLDVLASLQIPHRATIRYMPLDRAKAISELRKYRTRHYGQRKSFRAAAQERLSGQESPLLEQAAMDWEKEANQAQAEVQHGVVGYGYLTQTVTVWDADFRQATAKAEQVAHALNSRDFIAKVEQVNTMDAWVGSLPGNSYANVRRPLLHSLNLAHLIPATASWAGPTWNPHLHGPPLLRTIGRGHAPFNLDTYDGDVGMAYIAGPIGSGKSVSLATMVSAWLKYPGAQVRIFDTGQSLRCMTYAMGGHWYDIAAEIEQLAGEGGKLDDATTKPWGALWEPPDHHWQCFELEDLLKTPTLLSTVISPLLRTLTERLTGAPTLFVFDEGHLYLREQVFAKGIDDYIRGLRKKNGAVIIATQSIADAARSDLASIISDSSMTRIYLPNYHALEPETAKIYAGWGLNTRQCEIIASLVPKKEYYFQGRHGHRVFDLALGPAGLAFAGASRKPDLALMAQLYKGESVRFSIDWLHAKGLHEQAATLET